MSGRAISAPNGNCGEGKFQGASKCRLFFRWARPARPRAETPSPSSTEAPNPELQTKARAILVGHPGQRLEVWGLELLWSLELGI